MRSWYRRFWTATAFLALIACAICLESRSSALAGSTFATPEAVPESSSPSISPTLDSTASLTPQLEVASPIASTAAPNPTPTQVLATPTATASPPVDPIRVSAVTDDHATKPGATTSYRFRIANASSGPATVNLVASNSALGWSAKIFDASGRAPILGPIVAPAQGFVEVIVRVTSPRAARAGEQNSTTLTASLIP